MPHLRELLLGPGIAQLPNLFTPEEIANINLALDPLFEQRSFEKRSYAHADELVALGLWDQILSDGMMSAIFTIMPDPVLYHLHAYEIAANQTRSHIFSESLAGWHRDPDSAYVSGDPSHISIFVYLTTVGPRDGAFEFVPNCSPHDWLAPQDPFISVVGGPGYSFAWHRNYFHRASPNEGPVRRRLIKLSIQRNEFPSAHLRNEHFQRTLAAIPAGSPRMDLLLGRYQGSPLPALAPLPDAEARAIEPNGKLKLPVQGLIKIQVSHKMKMVVRRLRGGEIAQAVYD